MKRNDSGFTLVELIVVIAILGILSGIGVAGYSGYIQKANEAADNSLLGAVNASFAAACAETGIDFNKIGNNGATLSYTKGGPVTGIDSVSGLSGDGLAAAQESFLRYFAGNTAINLKYYEPGQINFVKGFGFSGNGVAMSLKSNVDNGDGTHTFTFDIGGKEVAYTVNDAQKAAFVASSLGKNMTASDLTNEVSDMVNAMASMMSSGGTQLAGILAGAGLDYTALGMDVYQKDASGNFILDGNGKKILDETKLANYDGDTYANAVVMMVSENTNAASLSALQTAITSGNLGDLIDMSDKAGTLSNVAMLYGVAEAYSHSDAAKGQKIGNKTAVEYMETINSQITAAAKNKDLEGVLTAIQMVGNFAYDENGGLTTEFSSYLTAASAGEQSQLETDAAGYIAAMQTVSGNKGALVDSGAMASGFDDPAIASILNAILGSD